MLKKFSFVLVSICLSLSAFSSSLMANVTSFHTVVTAAPERPAPPALNDGSRPCKPCQRPFKRLVAAMHELKKADAMTEDEFKKAFDTLMRIPRETFKDTKDMDQTAADTLYKGKVITDAQYKKISEFLKSNPSQR